LIVGKPTYPSQLGRVLVFSVLAVSVSSYVDAADLRLRMDPAAVKSQTAPSQNSIKQLYEEFLKWRKQQAR
jgi:hypothetical protein